ncbi:MAG: competence/damage-inducible protein A [Candidatus Omnitrophica bacterium]|nr:competence/damage-inducible protein A [Candidatus Omnitrophota bacterium]MDD5737621.1 competence/damage-inducible protein A [Candidatus Omnitrophota bacterium]
MKAEIISIGTEILLGQILNTNQQWLSVKLAELGIGVYHHSTVGDNPERLSGALESGIRRSDIVITTGGLGPTVDDITLQAISRTFQIESSRVIRNPVGTAPGFVYDIGGKLLIALPGPPRELNPMFERSVAPLLKKKYRGEGVLKVRTIRMTGLSESFADRKAGDLLKSPPPLTVGIYAKPALVELKIMAKAADEKRAKSLIDKADKKITSRLGRYIFGRDDETLEGAVGSMLSRARKTLAVAESCTGGLISSRITDVPGSSAYFRMGIVAYSNDIKSGLLGVRGVTLRRYGAVSRQTAVEMAKNVKKSAGADIGLSVTGIAGPSGTVKGKPVGLVYIAVSMKDRTFCREFRFRGEREIIKFRSSQAALDLLRVSL